MVCFTGTLDPRPSGRLKIESEKIFELKKEPGPGKCCVARCRECASNPKKKVAELWFCSRHWQQRWRIRNPKQAGYRALKDHAKARGLEFSIPFEYYLAIMDMAASFDPGAERRGDKVTIDRKDVTIGYRMGNLQLLTLSENVAKGNRERHLPAAVQAILERKRARMKSKEAWHMDEPDEPF